MPCPVQIRRLAACSLLAVVDPAVAAAQTVTPAQALDAARAAQAEAQEAQRRAENAAREAALAADRATAAADRLRDLIAAQAPSRPQPVTDERRVARASRPADDYATAYRDCGTARADIASLDYFRRAGSCEREVLADTTVSAARSRRVTGLGSAIAIDGAGTTATLMLGHNWRTRATRVDTYGPHQAVEQQRVSDWSAQVGVRATVDKTDKTRATIATFGSLDQLTSDVAVIAQFGRTFTTSEPWDRLSYASGIALVPAMTTSSLVSDRAARMQAAVGDLCRKDTGTPCEGAALLDWIFASKSEAGEPAEFAHPDAIKLYNAVFWGPPRDALPRFGWLVRGELSRPIFDYFPFDLIRIPDPFDPGETKTVIDPARFPADFAGRLVKGDARLNWSLSARGFFHVSRRRTLNYLSSHASALEPFLGWTLGTTFVGSLAYIRNDQIEKTFKAVKVCPPATAGQAFATDQACTTLDIAAPVRTEGVVGGIEMRQGIDLRLLPPALLAPRLTYNFDNEEFGIAAPIYFASDDKGVFTGGLRFGHVWGGKNADGTTKRPDTRIGVVFGVKIGLDGNSGID